MKIKVDRKSTPEGDLVFTVTVSEPHHACFDDVERNVMDILEFTKKGVEDLTPEDNKLRQDVVGLIHAAKEKAFTRVMNSLKFAIENDLRPKFKPICQEIYNWIYDNQKDVLKGWLSEFDPQRTKYYFDNDRAPGAMEMPQESEHDDDDDEEEDEE